VLLDVSSRPRCIHRGFSDLFCLLTLLLSSRRYADIGVLNLAPLKRLAQSARVVPSEPHPQPLCAEPLQAQAEEGLAVVTTVEESGAPPPPVTAATVDEEWTTVETVAPSSFGATDRGWLGRRTRGDGALGRRLGASPTGGGS
jgi:hypothetical protein